MPDLNAEPEWVWKFQDTRSNFKKLKPLVMRDHLLRSVLSPTMTNHPEISDHETSRTGYSSEARAND
jgi:hypothetical protein